MLATLKCWQGQSCFYSTNSPFTIQDFNELDEDYLIIEKLLIDNSVSRSMVRGIIEESNLQNEPCLLELDSILAENPEESQDTTEDTKT